MISKRKCKHTFTPQSEYHSSSSRHPIRKRFLGIFLSVCLIAAAMPIEYYSFPVQAAWDSPEIMSFPDLPEEVQPQTATVGTPIEELSLPDTLEAFEHSGNSSGDSSGSNSENSSGDNSGISSETGSDDNFGISSGNDSKNSSDSSSETDSNHNSDKDSSDNSGDAENNSGIFEDTENNFGVSGDTENDSESNSDSAPPKDDEEN